MSLQHQNRYGGGGANWLSIYLFSFHPKVIEFTRQLFNSILPNLKQLINLCLHQLIRLESNRINHDNNWKCRTDSR